MWLDPSAFRDLPANRHDIHAGAVLLPTTTPIVQGNVSSLDFVREQGGDEDTFVFMLGARRVLDPLGRPFDVLEGVFLSEGGPGFHPTWDLEQLLAETDRGGWTVIPRAEVLARWAERVEARMNR